MTDYNKIELYNSDNIDQLVWPKTKEGDFAKKMLFPLIKNGVQPYFDNVKTTMMAIKIDDFVLPITVNLSEIDNSYVCSFYSYYIGCALDNVDAIKNKFLQKSVILFIKLFGKILKRGKIDKVVAVDNWLFSTNLHPKLGRDQIIAVRQFIEKQFPDYAIAFRSINSIDPNLPIQSFKNTQFDLIASRQIYITDSKNKEIFETRIFKSDVKLLDKTDYQLGELETHSEDDLSKMLSLYKALYLDKHSTISPQLTKKYVKLLVDENVLKFKTLKKNNSIDGIVGYYSAYGTMNSPFFGYDTNLPQQIGLYRLLSTVLSLEAKNGEELFHQSSGASFYKSVRRATPDIEYNAVYTKHLSLSRRFYWKTLKVIMNDFGIYWMKKY